MPRRPAGQSATVSRHTPSPHQTHHKIPPISSTPIKSLSRTSSRGDLHRSSRPRSDMPDRPPPDKSSPHPSTPTPHKGGRRRRPNGKPPPPPLRDDRARSDVEHGGENDPSSEDDEILFDLLGVPTPAKANTPVPGLLPVSKAQLSRSRKSKGERDADQARRADVEVNGASPVTRMNGRGRRQPRGSMSESEMLSSTRKTRPNKKADRVRTADPNISSFPSNHDLSSLSASRPEKPQPISQRINPVLLEPTPSYDLSLLSQSLPSERGIQPPPPTSAKKGKGKKAKDAGADKDESAVWDMPELPPPSGSQSMTWQQKLQSTEPSETPRRNKSHSSSCSVNLLSEQKSRSRPASSHPANMTNPPISSPLVTRPAQTRRLSLDAASSSVPLSAFDHTIPYHTGYNVNRAPQTPMKLPTSHSTAANLPLQQGEYPRLKHGSKGPLGGFVQPSIGGGDSGKYAGPTFHNSPHAASLPKPDMDDF